MKDWSSFPAILFIFALIAYHSVQSIRSRRCHACGGWGKKTESHGKSTYFSCKKCAASWRIKGASYKRKAV